MSGIFELIGTGNYNLLSERLSENPALSKSKNEQGISPLQFAAYCRNKQAIAIIKPYLDRIDIYEASSLGDMENVLHLLEKDLSLINAFSIDGFTPLGLASFFGHLELVKILIEKGADPNLASKNEFKVTPLHSACAISNYGIAELLIENGADVNAKQMQGITPLHSAAHNGQSKLAKLLINSGAGINSETDKGQTPLSMAEEKKFKETSELLKKNGGR